MTASADSRYRVMLVEDDELEADLLVRILENAGYTVVHYADPMTAVKVLESTEYDIILSDYMMPRMNGLQFLGRARIHWPDSIRILVTSKGDFDVAVDAINRGEVYRFLRKPVDERELLVTLRLAGERREMARELDALRGELRRRAAAQGQDD